MRPSRNPTLNEVLIYFSIPTASYETAKQIAIKANLNPGTVNNILRRFFTMGLIKRIEIRKPGFPTLMECSYKLAQVPKEHKVFCETLLFAARKLKSGTLGTLKGEKGAYKTF
jgi:hypothetical protein